MNTALLVIQTSVLIALGLREIIRRGDRNLSLLILISASLVLVQGQAAYLLWDLHRNGEPVRYFFGLIFRDGFTLANLCATVSVLVIVASYLTASAIAPSSISRPAYGLHQGWGSYLLTILIAIAGASFIIHLWGGFGSFLHHDSAGMFGGQTLTLFILQIGTMPLLHRLAYSRRPLVIDWLLFTPCCALLMLNSRTLALICLFQLMLLRHYRTPQFRLARLALAGGIVALVLLGWGSLRDYLNYARARTVVDYYFGTASKSQFDPLAFFYRNNISTFSGLAGILSKYLRHNIQFDFGVDNLKLVTHLMPNAIRTGVLAGLDRYLVNLYPYQGSVVPGGYEAAFAHFSFVGLLALSLALGIAPTWIHRRLLDRGADRLKFAVVGASLPLLFLMDWWGVAFFTLGGLAALYIYRVTLFAGLLSVHAILPEPEEHWSGKPIS